MNAQYEVRRQMKYGRDGFSEVPDGWMVLDQYGMQMEWFALKRDALAWIAGCK